MTFLPIEDLHYDSPLTPVQIQERITASIEPKQMLRFRKKKDSKPYEGHISGDNFEINRIIGYRNSFLPQIKGNIQAAASGAVVEVKMRLSIFVYIFLAFWCGSLGIFFMTFLVSNILKEQFDPVIFIPLGMILFAYLMVTGGFKYEAKIAKKDLRKILEGRLKNKAP